MSKKEIDEYLGTLDEPKRATLAELRDTIVPDAEQCISYGMPACSSSAARPLLVLRLSRAA